MSSDVTPPDYTWLKTRNLSAFVRPDETDTTILEPSGSFCPLEEKLRLVVMVFTEPSNLERRRVIRTSWGKGLLDLPGVRLFFLLGLSNPNEPSIQV